MRIRDWFSVSLRYEKKKTRQAIDGFSDYYECTDTD